MKLSKIFNLKRCRIAQVYDSKSIDFYFNQGENADNHKIEYGYEPDLSNKDNDLKIDKILIDIRNTPKISEYIYQVMTGNSSITSIVSILSDLFVKNGITVEMADSYYDSKNKSVYDYVQDELANMVRTKYNFSRFGNEDNNLMMAINNIVGKAIVNSGNRKIAKKR
jgi:hypothetical protein